jgi:hypothetical protein
MLAAMGFLDHVNELLQRLTLEEKVSLLAAKDWWRTVVIEREGIFVPHVKVKPPIFPCPRCNQTFDISMADTNADNRWTKWSARRKLCQWHQSCLLPMFYLSRGNVRHGCPFRDRSTHRKGKHNKISECSPGSNSQCYPLTTRCVALPSKLANKTC